MKYKLLLLLIFFCFVCNDCKADGLEKAYGAVIIGATMLMILIFNYALLYVKKGNLFIVPAALVLIIRAGISYLGDGNRHAPYKNDEGIIHLVYAIFILLNITSVIIGIQRIIKYMREKELI